MDNKEEEIRELHKMVLKARKQTQNIDRTIKQDRDTLRIIKEMNDRRIRLIQEESQKLDSEQSAKEARLNKAKSVIENQIWEARAKLLRRIILCNLKNLLKGIQSPSAPDNILSTIYAGQFAVVYDDITIGSKPVNQYEWNVRVELAEEPSLRGLLESVWPAYREIHWGYGGESRTFYQRDFKSEEKAKGYAERNRAKICQKLIEGIKQVEQEISMAISNIDTVFDFRLIIHSTLDPQYSGSEKFLVASARKHKLVLTPVLSVYDEEVQKIKPYTITVTQRGYQLTIKGHRFSSQARDIKYALYKYFKVEFKAIEADTHQEIQNPY